MAKSSFDFEQSQLMAEARAKELAEKKAADQEAKQKRKDRFDKIFQIFLVILAFVLGLIADNIGLFHK